MTIWSKSGGEGRNGSSIVSGFGDSSAIGRGLCQKRSINQIFLFFFGGRRRRRNAGFDPQKFLRRRCGYLPIKRKSEKRFSSSSRIRDMMYPSFLPLFSKRRGAKNRSSSSIFFFFFPCRIRHPRFFKEGKRKEGGGVAFLKASKDTWGAPPCPPSHISQKRRNFRRGPSYFGKREK